MARLSFLLLFITLAVPAYGQSAFALPTKTEQHIADAVSWGTVLTDVALDTKASWDRPDRTRAFVRQGERTALTYGLVFLAKMVVHRARPCAPDCGSVDSPNYSFFSGHTALAFSTLGGPRLAIMLPFAAGTGGLRLAANKHWWSDVLVGAGVGALTSRIR